MDRKPSVAVGAERLARWSGPSRPGHVMLDLWTANEDLLVEAGVARDRTDNPRLCAACHPEWFYSYRKGNRGRLVTVAALQERTSDASPSRASQFSGAAPVEASRDPSPDLVGR